MQNVDPVPPALVNLAKSRRVALYSEELALTELQGIPTKMQQQCRLFLNMSNCVNCNTIGSLLLNMKPASKIKSTTLAQKRTI